MIFHASFSSCCGANCHFDQQHVHFFDLGLGFWCLILWIGGHRSQLGLNFLFLFLLLFSLLFTDNYLFRTLSQARNLELELVRMCSMVSLPPPTSWPWLPSRCPIPTLWARVWWTRPTLLLWPLWPWRASPHLLSFSSLKQVPEQPPILTSSSIKSSFSNLFLYPFKVSIQWFLFWWFLLNWQHWRPTLCWLLDHHASWKEEEWRSWVYLIQFAIGFWLHCPALCWSGNCRILFQRHHGAWWLVAWKKKKRKKNKKKKQPKNNNQKTTTKTKIKLTASSNNSFSPRE